jgi:hypothetical protein
MCLFLNELLAVVAAADDDETSRQQEKQINRIKNILLRLNRNKILLLCSGVNCERRDNIRRGVGGGDSNGLYLCRCWK